MFSAGTVIDREVLKVINRIIEKLENVLGDITISLETITDTEVWVNAEKVINGYLHKFEIEVNTENAVITEITYSVEFDGFNLELFKTVFESLKDEMASGCASNVSLRVGC